MADPVLYVGVDIGIKRDTSAVAAVYRCRLGSYELALWGIRTWSPPVSMVRQVEPCLLRLLEQCRVAEVRYDPTQFQTTADRLSQAGYGNRLVEVNQLTEMTTACSTLHSHIHERKLLLVRDAELRLHIAHANVKMTERGPRIIKAQQARPIDGVVALAMALLGATGDEGYLLHPSLEPDAHTRSMRVLP